MDEPGQKRRVGGRQIRLPKALRGGEARTGDNPPKPGSQEKPLSTTCGNPYRKPTQVGGCKSTQARGRTLAKELCKLAP
ncbi:uncharacterized protein TTMY_1627 [Thermus thermophilus]|nr:Uncharacterized protein TTMY_1091 [Thermus thermophilus]BAW02007.1 uncharacterized protein TTMY_1627 [Thermus thermophilus]